MARTILHTTGFFLALLCGIIMIAGVAASTPVITVTQGESVTVSADTNYGLDGQANELTVSVPDMAYYRNVALLNDPSARLVDTFTVNAAPGSHAMSVRVGSNGETLRFTQYTLTVLPASTKPAATATPNKITIASMAGPRPDGIRIEPIADMLPGESFVLPLTITGHGTYTIEIPTLGFAYYEVPNPVTVNGEIIVPVLITLKNDIQPGTYLIPVTVNDESTTARVRIISYRENTTFWLIPLGIALILLALVILFLRVTPKLPPRTPPRQPSTPPKDDTDEALITYY